METVEFGLLPPEVRSELHGDEVDPFDARRVPPIEWRQKDRNIALRDADGTHVASAGTLIAEVEIAGERIPVVGLGGVMVRAPDRGRGLARQVVIATLARASATARRSRCCSATQTAAACTRSSASR